MNEYKDRGIIKWSPFDGLAGFVDMLGELRYKLGRIPKPSVADDALCDMDYALKEAYETKRSVEISYYDDGYIKRDFGLISRVDELKRVIVIGDNRYLLEDIISLCII